MPITPSDDVQAIIDSNPIKTTYCVAAGTYRVKRPIVPQRNDTLIDEPATVIDGARPVRMEAQAAACGPSAAGVRGRR